MNEFLRLVRKSLRPFGYDIRKRGTYNLLPFQSLEKFPDLVALRKDFDYDGGPERPIDADLDKLNIILRTCIRDDRNAKAHGKLTGVPLAETVMRCLRSVAASVNDALARTPAPRISVTILDDHSDDVYVQQIKVVLAALKCVWNVRTTTTRGQGASLHEQFSLARDGNALYYFCEDDYLHEPSALYEMWEFYRQVYGFTHRHLVIHPQESESLYGGAHYPSYLLLSSYRHWRSCSHATHMLMTHAHVVRDNWDCFEGTKYVGNRKMRKYGSESRTTNRLFDQIPCMVPLPALAAHLQQEDSLPPFFDWRKLWERYAA